MTAHVMDLHGGPMAKESWDFFFRFFRHVDDMGKLVVIEGGWAVAAHGSPVASVDLDVLVRTSELEGDHDFYDLLHGEGDYARPETISAVDWGFIEEFNRAWATTKGYDRAKLLEGRTVEMPLKAPDGRGRKVVVPTIPALLVMKLKAFRDRDLQARVMRDPALVASYDPNDVAQVHPDASYRLRKPAKDLVDIGFLWRRASDAERAEVVQLLQANGLRDLASSALRDAAPEVIDAADYLIERHGMGDDAEEIRSRVRKALR